MPVDCSGGKVTSLCVRHESKLKPRAMSARPVAKLPDYNVPVLWDGNHPSSLGYPRYLSFAVG